MAESSQLPFASSPARRSPGSGQPDALLGVPAVVVAVGAVVLGTALLGVAAGFAWAAVAPRALVVVIGRGSADVVNPETNAFIAADGWFTLLTAVGGIVSGLLGYALAVRRHGVPAMTAVMAGALAATLLAKWVGQHSGMAAFNRALQAGQPGVLQHAPLTLGGLGALAFWTLTAGLTAGGIEATVMLRERRAARAQRVRRAGPGG